MILNYRGWGLGIVSLWALADQQLGWSGKGMGVQMRAEAGGWGLGRLEWTTRSKYLMHNCTTAAGQLGKNRGEARVRPQRARLYWAGPGLLDTIVALRS